ncbi:mitoferrin-2 isoform X1 [Boleophthalmus pectinirostris]|uniref:mitoferrin-2 isoform X1 n=1 Tax=Boleophthalmus pectinirostris TaxID=150288 RepID=UPI00242C73BD|nr:mitoferrin-2 isoform X1 [Boleophthalmus pectinirostris]
METDGFVRKRRMTAESPGWDPGVAGASAGAEVRLLGGRFWGVSESIVGSLTPRIGGETEIQTVDIIRVATEQTEDHEPDYEGLPQGASTRTHMLAGAVAGIMEHCLMFPVDCVKTRMQSLQPEPAARYRNVMDALRRIIATEGLWRPMRGLNATAIGAGPAHALYFASYEKLKRTLSDVIHPGANSHLANGAAGCVATLLHDAIMNPAEVVKQRMQMYNSPYRGVLDCIGAVWQKEGAAAFYRSYTTQLTMNVPFQAFHFMTYEYLQERLNPHRQYNPSSHMLSGALAGAIAAAVTTPLDVCKTLLNTQESLAVSSMSSGQGPGQGQGAHRHISGLAHAFRTVYRLGGLKGFFKGVQARVIYQMPSTAISWSVYEFFKYGLTKHQHNKRRTQTHLEAEM